MNPLGSVTAHEQIHSALGVIRAYNDLTSTIEDQQQHWDAAATEVATTAAAAAADFVGGVDIDEDLLVDSELVRDLVESGSADAIVAEQAAKALLRRRKHRENMIRYRRKKKMSFEEMRAEEQRLAEQLQNMLHLHISKQQEQQQQQAETETETDATMFDQEQEETALQSMAMSKFVDVLAQKERLHHENVMLRHRLADYHKFQQAVNEASEQEEEEEGRVRQERLKGGGVERGEGMWVRFLEHDTPFYYEPFSRDECSEIASNTFQKVFAHQCGYMAGNGPHGSQVLKLFDWTARLAFEWDETIQMTMIRYQFKKTFRNPQMSVDQLVNGEWTILHNSKLYQNVHRVPVNSQILQRVNDTMSVGLWNAPAPDQTQRFRNVSLFTRGRYTSPQGRDGGIVTITGMQLKNFKEQELQLLNEFWKKHACDTSTDSGASNNNEDEEEDDDGHPVYTHGGFLYTSFANDENGDVEVEFGGRVDTVSEEQGRFLMVELGGTCVRLEHLLFPFRVLGSG